MKSKYTRDVSTKMIEELKNQKTFAAFVDYVKENKNKDLALCFRGNDSELGKVDIYRNNHMMWELMFKDGVPVIRINTNHARFMDDWKSRVVKDLMGLGFRGPKGQDYAQLEEENGFVVRHKHDDKYSYDAVFLYYYPTSDYCEIKKVVEKSYMILKEMQESYFSQNHDEIFEVYYPKSKVSKKEPRPHNYIKQYYFDNNKDAENVDPDTHFYANFQKCLEKHVQQDLFMHNHFLKDGLFIYDLEFTQPSGVPGVKVENKNKPDMFALRFDSEGKIVSICMIEVKSTKSALGQNSGLDKHLEGMEAYLKIKKEKGTLMDDRIIEAREILNQYFEIGFYDIEGKYSESDFDGIKKEIIFVFSNELTINDNVHKGVTIRDILSGYNDYENMRYGEILGHADVVIKEYP